MLAGISCKSVEKFPWCIWDLGGVTLYMITEKWLRTRRSRGNTIP